jgi:hypothetical protein
MVEALHRDRRTALLPAMPRHEQRMTRFPRKRTTPHPNARSHEPRRYLPMPTRPARFAGLWFVRRRVPEPRCVHAKAEVLPAQPAMPLDSLRDVRDVFERDCAISYSSNAPSRKKQSTGQNTKPTTERKRKLSTPWCFGIELRPQAHDFLPQWPNEVGADRPLLALHRSCCVPFRHCQTTRCSNERPPLGPTP